MAIEKWTGIVVRCQVTEAGNVPRAATSNSPDIILAGTTPFEDPSFLTLEENYKNAYDNKLYIGQPNYLYVRGKNFTDGALGGSWNLFYSTPNILLYPYLWQNNQLATSTGDLNPAFSIAAGKIGASTDCFRWVPADTSDHYCMIGLANTPDHPNPVLGVNNITSLADILTANANIAQRNVQMIRGNVPEVVSTAGYDQGAEGSKVDLSVIWENFPKGSSFSIASGTPLNGKALKYVNTNIQDNDFKVGWPNLDIPAFWQTLFSWSLKFGSDWTGIPKDAHPTVTIRGELVQESKDRLYHRARDADPHPETGLRRMDAFGGPVRVITVGTVKTVCPDIVHR